MKYLIFLLIILGAIYFYPAENGSAIYTIQSKMKSIGKSDADYMNELKYKREELEAYENAILQVTNTFEREIENAPICPTTGEKAKIVITEDPRDDLEEKCEALREEIAALEEKIKS